MLTPRQALILVSERMVKPNLGKEYFAWRRDLADIDRITGATMCAIDASCGFQEEVDFVTLKSQHFYPVVVKITGRGAFGEGDSRGDVTADRIIEIDNSGTYAQFISDGLKKLLKFLAEAK